MGEKWTPETVAWIVAWDEWRQRPWWQRLALLPIRTRLISERIDALLLEDGL